MVSSVAMDDKDANEIKLEKNGSFNAMQGLAPSCPGEGNSYSEIIMLGTLDFTGLGDYQ